MKKSKLLIPALTVASVGAVVAPLMTLTSCGDNVVASTTDLDYKGEQHAAVTGGLSLSKATDEYLKDTKYFAQDTLTFITSLLKYVTSSMTEEGGYKNVKVESASASISNISLTAKEAKIDSPDIYNKNAIKGALASGKMTIKYVLSYDREDLEQNTNASLIKKVHNVQDMAMTMSFTDCFLFLTWDCGIDMDAGELTNSRFAFNLYGCKNASENWKLDAHMNGTYTQTITTTSGDTLVQSSQDSQSMVLSAKMSDDTSVFGTGLKDYGGVAITQSNYLSKIDWDESDVIYMGYDEDRTWPYSSGPITLTNGKDYTFTCDVKAAQNIINFMIVNADAETLPFTVKSCTLNGTNVTYTVTNKIMVFDSKLADGTFKITVTIGGTAKNIATAALYPDGE